MASNVQPEEQGGEDTDAARNQRHLQRAFTQCGNRVQFPVTLAATTQVVPWVRTEVDTAYGVSVTPNWLTTVAVTARAIGSVTITFGTAAPASAVVDVSSFRSEDP